MFSKIYRQPHFAAPLAFVMTALIVGCGPKEQNPVAQYQGLIDKSVAAHNQSAPEQTYLQTDIFQISGDHPGEDMPFVVGQESTHNLNIRRFDRGFEVNLVAENLPKGAELKEDPSNPDLWYLKWTPGEEIIPTGKSFARLPLKIRLFAAHQDPEIGKVLAQIEGSATLNAVVYHQTEQPLLDVPDLSQATISDKEAFNFSIAVADPTSANQTPPTIMVYFPESYTNQDHTWYDLSSRVRRDPKASKPKREKDGSWTFRYIIDTSDLPIVIANKAQKSLQDEGFVHGLIAFRAYGSTKVPSSESVQKFKVQLNPQTPNITLADKIITAKGETQEIHFQVYSPNGHGSVTVSEADFQKFVDDKKITGVALKCDKPNQAQQNCRLILDYDCTAKTQKSVNISLRVNSELKDRKPLQTDFSRTIQIQAGEICKSSKKGGKS